jgi:hypothetical protein
MGRNPFITAVGCAVAMLVGHELAVAQTVPDLELARLLADGKTREYTVARIASMGIEKIPLLLSWTRKPPSGLLESELNVGLADVFGRLRTTEAIPFLIKNIALERVVPGETWTKAPEVVEFDLPAAGALIRIGPAASKAVMQACQSPMLPMDRLVAVFVVSRIKGVPEAKQFLAIAEWQARAQLLYATEHASGDAR